MNRLSLRNYNPVLVQEFRKITDRFRGICGICLNSNKGNTERSQHVLTWLHLETLGYWPIMPENLPDTVGDGLQYPLKLVNWSPRSDSLVTSRSRHAYTIYSPTYHVCSYCEAILWIFLIFFLRRDFAWVFQNTWFMHFRNYYRRAILVNILVFLPMWPLNAASKLPLSS